MNMSMFISQKIKVRLRPSLWDALVVAAVLAIAAALFLFLLPKAAGSGDLTCTISQNGQILDTIPISVGATDEERTYGDYVVQFSHGHIRVESAPCANQDCVHTGWISRGGQSIVCLPGRFVVELAAESGENDDFDIVVK